ncbi:ATPase/histidine kinase/DNA gyrase B/HSP90 domain protein [Actinomyces sp. oral taxon 848 str. F0332]|nr:ATPase/histidine kinase/DNA gyrase B/HSP90 domain protein [Actinomyces sp. oral taxon 848 str. F0332]
MSTVEMVPPSNASGATYDKAVKATEANGYRVAGQRRTFRKRLGRAVAYSAYMLSAAPIHLGLFIAVAVLIPLGGGLTLIGGVVVILLGIMVARLGATAQRRLNEKTIGAERPEFIYAAPKSDGKVIRFLYPLRDPQSWLDVLWVFVSFPIAIANWCIAFIWVLMTSVSLAQPLTLWIIGVSNVNHGYRGIGEALNIPHPYLFDAGFGFCMGLLSLVFGPYLVNAAGNVQFYVADVLLLRRARDRADIERLTRSREAGRRAESAALRRLERDLHDGPQQRLVRLNMDLARARRQAGSDPVRAQAILDEAMVQTQDTLAELRQLSRGIAPPVLVDRGLVAAVQEAAARSVVPVSVHAGIPAVPDHVASAAYYVVAESLVNVNKHAGASSVVVTIDVSGGVLRLSVVDDGVGGADVSKGHGLVGLEERLRSVDGTLEIDSPAGGPTTIEAEIPCV